MSKRLVPPALVVVTATPHCKTVLAVPGITADYGDLHQNVACRLHQLEQPVSLEYRDIVDSVKRDSPIAAGEHSPTTAM